eukprot:5435241-Prymnesium_polylepis.1
MAMIAVRLTCTYMGGSENVGGAAAPRSSFVGFESERNMPLVDHVSNRFNISVRRQQCLQMLQLVVLQRHGEVRKGCGGSGKVVQSWDSNSDDRKLTLKSFPNFKKAKWLRGKLFCQQHNKSVTLVDELGRVDAATHCAASVKFDGKLRAQHACMTHAVLSGTAHKYCAFHVDHIICHHRASTQSSE